MKKAFKRIGLTFEDGVILQNIYNNPGTNQIQISNALILDTAAVARALKDLEQKGFVVRKIDSTNERKKVVNVTEEGGKLALKINAIMEAWDEQIFSDLSNEEANRLIANMRFLKEKADLLDVNELVEEVDALNSTFIDLD